MRFTFTFICQRGALEAKAVLLAASLRRQLAAPADVVACLPMPEAVWGRPSRHTLRALDTLEVVTAPVRNLIADAYPIGNKIACLDPPASHGVPPDRIVFLDTDILCTAPFVPDRELAADFAAKPVDFATFTGGPAAWARLYRLFGLPEPARRVVATVSREETWPYFNAGVIGVRADAGLAPAWAECCRRIDAEEWVPARRPHLDQIALPIAAALCGLDVTPLDERLNYPAHLRPLRPALPVLCHYHRPDIVAEEQALSGLVRDLVAAYPAVRPVLEADPAWRPIVGTTRPRRWWSFRTAPSAPEPPAAAPPANDVAADALAAALERSPTPDLLQTVVDVSRRRFGWFTRHPSRAFEYPWVVARLSARRGGRVVDVGAGVSPVPLLLALYGVLVTTVDDSLLVRDPAAGAADWDEWGFLDYGKLDASITSVQGDAADLAMPPGSCAAVYSISVVEHMPAATRRRLWPRLAAWLSPGGALVLTVDLMPGTEHLWNRASGQEVEPIDQHGDLPGLIAELGGLGFRLDERSDLRGLPGMRADVSLLAFTKTDGVQGVPA